MYKAINEILNINSRKASNMNTDSSCMTVDPVLAKQLLSEGALLIIAGVPVGTEFGIDLCFYTVGENFRGVKMIPPGPHYIWCASKGPYGDTAPRVGFVHFFKPQEILVREWDKANEELRERLIDDPDLEKKRIRDNIQSLDQFLGAYDLRYFNHWRHLIDTVTEPTVNRCRPERGVIRTNIELESCPDKDRPRGPIKTYNLQSLKQVAHEDDLLPNLKPIPGTAPNFTQLPDRIPKNSTSADISRHSLDCIDAVTKLFATFESPNDVIEELQLSFAFFLVGYSVESLANWRKLLNLLSHSENAVEKWKLFYMKYSEVLAYQLPHLPEELMEETDRNTVYKDVRSLLINLHSVGLNANAERLMKKLNKSLHWKFDGLFDEDPEDLPTVVEDLIVE